MSVLHRVDEVDDMDSVKFIQYSMRLTAYNGVIAAIAAKERDEGGNVSSNEIQSDTTTLGASEISGLFETVKVDPNG